MKDVQIIPAIKFDRDDFTIEIDQMEIMKMQNLNSITDKMRAARATAVENSYTVYEWFDHARYNSCIRFVRNRREQFLE